MQPYTQYVLYISDFSPTDVLIQPAIGAYGGPLETVEIMRGALEYLVTTDLYQNSVSLRLSQVVFTPETYQFPRECTSLELDRCIVPGPFPFPQGLQHLTITTMDLGFPLVIPPQTRTLILENCLLPDLPAIPETVQTLKMNLMTIAGDFMHQLPALPNGLVVLEAETNGLAALPPVPPGIIELNVAENLLTELPPLAPTLRYLRAHTNRLTRLPPLPASLEYLNVHTNLLESLPLPLPPNLRITEEGLMANPWNPLFEWFFNRFQELYQQLGWQQDAQIQQQIRQELNTEVQRLANLRQKGRNVSAANQTLRGLVPRNVLGAVTRFLSGESGAPKAQTLKLREKATRPHSGPGVGGRRRKRKTMRRRRN
jgi:hypothetical protein